MKRILLGVIGLLCLCVACQRKDLSFKPGEVWPDDKGVHINAHGGGILRVGDTYYWFGEHKTEGSAGNLAQVGVHCYSSKDLYNWKDEGIALSVVPDDTTSHIAKGCVLERPKVIYNKKNDQYVMWFHLEPRGAGYSGALSGVAVSKNVVGPYSFVNAFRPNAGFWPVNVQELHKQPCTLSADLRFSGGELPAHPDSLNLLGRDQISGQMARDMNLFVDDDGIAYHIYSSEENSTAVRAGLRMRDDRRSLPRFGDLGRNWKIRLGERTRRCRFILRARTYCLYPAMRIALFIWEIVGLRRTL